MGEQHLSGRFNMHTTHTHNGVQFSGVDIFDLRIISGILDYGGRYHASIQDAWYAIYKDLRRLFYTTRTDVELEEVEEWYDEDDYNGDADSEATMVDEDHVL
jgi:hypothetical protein